MTPSTYRPDPVDILTIWQEARAAQSPTCRDLALQLAEENCRAARQPKPKEVRNECRS